jgi:hypothetical protein
VLSDETYYAMQKSNINPLYLYSSKIISFHTFSKIFAPGVRTGWLMTLNDQIISRLNDSGFIDSGGSINPIQGLIMFQVIETAEYDDYLRGMLLSLESKRDLICQVLDSYPSAPGNMSFRFNSDSTAGAYVYNINYYPVDVGSGVTRNTTGYSSTSCNISEGTIQTSDNNNTVYITVPNYADSTVRKLFDFNNGFQNFGSNQSLSTGGGYWNNVAAITSVSIITSGGTWTQGTIKIWGIK